MVGERRAAGDVDGERCSACMDRILSCVGEKAYGISAFIDLHIGHSYLSINETTTNDE